MPSQIDLNPNQAKLDMSELKIDNFHFFDNDFW